MKYTIFGKQIKEALDKQALFAIRDNFVKSCCNGDINNYHNVLKDDRIKHFALKYEKQIIDDINEKVLTDSPYKFVHMTEGSSYTNSAYGDAELQDKNGNKILAVDFKWAAFTDHLNEVATPTLRSLKNFGNNDESNKHYYICFNKEFNIIEIYNAKIAYESRKAAGDFDNQPDLDKSLSASDARRFIKSIGEDINIQTPIFQYPVYNTASKVDSVVKSKVDSLRFENIELDNSLIIRYENSNTLGDEFNTFLAKKTFVINESTKDDTAAMTVECMESDEVNNTVMIYFKSSTSRKFIQVIFKKQSDILMNFLKSEANKEIIRDDNKFYSIEFL